MVRELKKDRSGRTGLCTFLGGISHAHIGITGTQFIKHLVDPLPAGARGRTKTRHIILLNKCDLLPYIDFDEDFFMKRVRALNQKAPVIKVSGKTDEGYEKVVEWIVEKARSLQKK